MTKAIWVAGPSPNTTANDVRSLTTNTSAVQLRRDAGPPLLLSASQKFRIVEDPREGFEGEWKSSTLEYIYEVRVDPDSVEPSDRVDLFGWHWHPLTTPARLEPHMHVRTPYPALGATLGKLHLPTGRVSFEEVILFLICELGVTPVREDWEEVLAETLMRFKTYRTWP